MKHADHIHHRDAEPNVDTPDIRNKSRFIILMVCLTRRVMPGIDEQAWK